MVNIKSAYMIIIVLFYEGLTQVHSQKKPRLHFCTSFALNRCLNTTHRRQNSILFTFCRNLTFIHIAPLTIDAQESNPQR